MQGRGYEKLVALYLRLNGYFIIENFIIHPRDRGSQRGEVDVFGVRLPYQAEMPGETMLNDPKLVQTGNNCIDVVFVEVKGRRRPRPNGSWYTEGVLEYVLRFVGFTPEEKEIKKVADSLRRVGDTKSEGSKFCFRIVAFSERPACSSNVKAITLDHVLQWIHKRFERWAQVKTQRDQWHETLQDYLLNAGSGVTLEDVKKWGQSERRNIT